MVAVLCIHFNFVSDGHMFDQNQQTTNNPFIIDTVLVTYQGDRKWTEHNWKTAILEYL